MTRHSRNCTANAVYSYGERQRDARASGFGSLKARFSKDGIKEFDCCCLSLHPCKDPVITTDGYLYEREAILEYLLAKKTEVKKKMKEYERQCKKEQEELAELCEAEKRSKVEKFLKSDPGSERCTLQSNDSDLFSLPSTSKKSVGDKKATEKNKKLPSFWIPALTPDNKDHKLLLPEKSAALCPMSGKPLRLKDLTSVKFTTYEDDMDKRKLDGKNERFKCPVTGDVLGNQIPCAVLRPTGDVVTMECVELIRKDMRHPLTGVKMTGKDIIPMQRGGTGFASVNQELVAAKPRPVMQA